MKNRYLSIGLILYGGTMGIGHFITLPDVIRGFGVGLGIAFLLLGLYASGHDMSRLKKFKRNSFKHLLRK